MAASAAIQTALGAAQWYKGHKLEKQQVRPVYEIPSELKNYLSSAEQMALQGLPDEQKQQYLDNVSRNVQAGLYGLDKRNAAIAGVGSVVGQANEAAKDLLVADSNVKRQNKLALQDARANYGQYQDKAFNLNKYEPYAQNMNYARDLQSWGTQNFGQGAGQLADTPQENANKGIQAAALFAKPI